MSMRWWSARRGRPWAWGLACLMAWMLLVGPGAAGEVRAETVKIEITTPTGVEPVLALVLSLVVPGLGQVITGRVTRGVLIFVGAVGLLVVGMILATLLGVALGSLGAICMPLVGLAYLAYAVWAGLDAFHLAKGPPGTATPRRSKRTRRSRHLRPLPFAPTIP